MFVKYLNFETPIDAVITWVDGKHPVHTDKRERYLGKAQSGLHENGTNPHRWRMKPADPDAARAEILKNVAAVRRAKGYE